MRRCLARCCQPGVVRLLLPAIEASSTLASTSAITPVGHCSSLSTDGCSTSQQGWHMAAARVPRPCHMHQQQHQGWWRSSATAPHAPHAPQPQQTLANHNSCWSCNSKFQKGGMVCKGCHKIQPLDPELNYFELLGMPAMRYDLDVGLLDQQYKRLQWAVHPDRLMLKSPQEREYSAENASQVNHAYSVLRNPLSRAHYMLAQRGVSTGESSEATISDAEYLAEVMDAREAVEETDDAEELGRLLADNRAQQQELIHRLGRAFESHSGTREAADLTMRLTYLAKLEAEIVAKLPATG